ncbi:DoxX family membrane protein [Actinomadura rupiterrae]|uniref:DoxX family membrane protein n=1 Tax=Actinomadura rupiterrae TaxID=559627 RepID=UPI0020A4C1EB|nr:DoxX family membrane protein [Actinomadura rupiterrae]MCP2340107.1 putative membrane protein YphA (DoxX/SURF4 family) [Actinomadura rupiterrae]
MRPITTPARPLVAAPYIITGLDALRDPGPRAEQVAPAVKPIADRLDWLPTKDPVALVRIQGALSLGTGALLLTGRFRRFTTLLAAVQLVPALATEHRYWTEDDPERRRSERSHLLKNAALFGALLMVAGSPGRGRTAELRHQLHEAQTRAAVEGKALRKQAATEVKALRRQARSEARAAQRDAALRVWKARQRARKPAGLGRLIQGAVSSGSGKPSVKSGLAEAGKATAKRGKAASKQARAASKIASKQARSASKAASKVASRQARAVSKRGGELVRSGHR